jgi:N-acetylglutamate synthase-like GNAT family acetyltransferase
MIREAKAGDEAAILAFLRPHMATSMFLASNLLAHGLFERAHRHGTEYWIVEKEGKISGVFGRAMSGIVVLQCPDASADT